MVILEHGVLNPAVPGSRLRAGLIGNTTVSERGDRQSAGHQRQRSVGRRGQRSARNLPLHARAVHQWWRGPPHLTLPPWHPVKCVWVCLYIWCWGLHCSVGRLTSSPRGATFDRWPRCAALLRSRELRGSFSGIATVAAFCQFVILLPECHIDGGPSVVLFFFFFLGSQASAQRNQSGSVRLLIVSLSKVDEYRQFSLSQCLMWKVQFLAGLYN